jgi:hypothetical protein
LAAVDVVFFDGFGVEVAIASEPPSLDHSGGASGGGAEAMAASPW